jgi:3-oxoacyl-[acyl-carrier-protein] synthase I
VTVPLSLVAHAARTPLGLIAETSAAAVRAGLSRIEEFPFIGVHGEPIFAGLDAKLPTSIFGPERVLALAWSVLDEVARKLTLLEFTGSTQLTLVLPEPRSGFGQPQAQAVRDSLAGALTQRGWPVEIGLGLGGHAGVAQILERIAGDPRDDLLYLVVAVDSYIQPEAFEWLERAELLFGPRTPNGLTPSEAGACLALASDRLRANHRLPVLAHVRGTCTASEVHTRDSETGSLGEALATAVRGATEGLVLPDQAPEAIYIDLNGERYRSEEWGFVNLRVAEVFGPAIPTIPADCWGDVGAASGALFAILAAQSWARGYAPGPRALCLTSSFSGLRGAVLLESP